MVIRRQASEVTLHIGEAPTVAIVANDAPRIDHRLDMGECAATLELTDSRRPYLGFQPPAGACPRSTRLGARLKTTKVFISSTLSSRNITGPLTATDPSSGVP